MSLAREGKDDTMIQDKFSDLPVTRQRKYQLRQRELGRCCGCGASSGGPKLCGPCAAKDSERDKIIRGRKRGKANRVEA